MAAKSKSAASLARRLLLSASSEAARAGIWAGAAGSIPTSHKRGRMGASYFQPRIGIAYHVLRHWYCCVVVSPIEFIELPGRATKSEAIKAAHACIQRRFGVHQTPEDPQQETMF
jgi:hypothetical protein